MPGVVASQPLENRQLSRPLVAGLRARGSVVILSGNPVDLISLRDLGVPSVLRNRLTPENEGLPYLFRGRPSPSFDSFENAETPQEHSI
jgi:hypothetical protein